VETREEKRPVLSDLAESGSIEAEADLVSFLYRPNYYRQREQGQEEGAEHATATEKRLNDNEPDEAEIIIAKHRNGPIGDVKVMFDKRYRLFVDIDRHAGTSGMP
jgi:replicative DNA helicase